MTRTLVHAPRAALRPAARGADHRGMKRKLTAALADIAAGLTADPTYEGILWSMGMLTLADGGPRPSAAGRTALHLRGYDPEELADEAAARAKVQPMEEAA